MIVTIHPSQLNGKIHAPASKSYMQRACAAALLSKGTTIIKNSGISNDDKAALDIIQQLGASIEFIGDELYIKSNGVIPISNEINCGESGLSMRMFTPLAALCEKEITISGEGTLLNRPMNFFDEILPVLGVQVQSNHGKLPLIIQGPLLPRDIEIDGSLSSQFLTGLLMAFSAADAKGKTIKVKGLKSAPYINLTLEVMRQFGMKVPENRNNEEFHFQDSTTNNLNTITNYTVKGDWSGGAFLLVAGALAGSITVIGLNNHSLQADRKIIDALQLANAKTEINFKEIKVYPSELKAFEFDATDCPDLFPPLTALAAYCKGISKIKGVSRLEHKESNRALTLQQEFGKMGVKIKLAGDDMLIEGNGVVKGTVVHSQHDHRIAMACAVAALKAEGVMEIEESQAVNKSYPNFFLDLEKLGATVSLKK